MASSDVARPASLSIQSASSPAAKPACARSGMPDITSGTIGERLGDLRSGQFLAGHLPSSRNPSSVRPGSSGLVTGDAAVNSSSPRVSSVVVDELADYVHPTPPTARRSPASLPAASAGASRKPISRAQPDPRAAPRAPPVGALAPPANPEIPATCARFVGRGHSGDLVGHPQGVPCRSRCTG